MKHASVGLATIVWALWALGSWGRALPAAPGAAGAAPPEASQAPQPASPPAPGDSSAQAVVYRLRPGDTVSVTVLGEPQYSGSFAVRPDGTVLFPDEMVGTVAVGGRTLQEAHELVSARIGEFVKDPTVILAISRFKVPVVGEVRKPGEYELAAGTRLLEAVTTAGGAEDRKAGLQWVYLTKLSGQELACDLKEFQERGDISQNPVVEAGDRISVGRPSAGRDKRGEFKVTGAVKEAGSYPLHEGEETRLSDAITRAGRWSEEANPRAAQLMRADGTVLPVDLTLLDEDPRSEKNVVLRAGDELFVPRNRTEVNVLGGVKKPGQYFVAPGTTLLEVIAVAGGLEEGAILRGCAVVRTQPKPVRIRADLERLMKQGDVSQNPVLEDRDVVFVPVRPPASGRPSGPGTLERLTDTMLRYWWLFRVF